MLCERLVIHQVMTYNFHHLFWKLRVSVLQYQNDTTIHKYFLQKRSCIGWRISISTFSWALAFPIHGSFIHIAYNLSNLDHQYRSQSAFTSASGIGLCYLPVDGLLTWVILVHPQWMSSTRCTVLVTVNINNQSDLPLLWTLGWDTITWKPNNYEFNK